MDVNQRLAFDFVAISILAKGDVFGFPDALADCRSENRTPVPVGDIVRYETFGSGAFPKGSGRQQVVRNVRVDGQLVFNNVPMILKAARAGFGLARVLEDRVTADLAEGSLYQRH